MLTDDEIQARARVFIDIYGDDAQIQAQVRFMKYTQEESLSVAAEWQRLMEAVEKIESDQKG